MDTVEANLSLGFPEDRATTASAPRSWSTWACSKMRIMTNNPKKLIALRRLRPGAGRPAPHSGHGQPHNLRYLETKRDRMGHTLTVVNE